MADCTAGKVGEYIAILQIPTRCCVQDCAAADNADRALGAAEGREHHSSACAQPFVGESMSSPSSTQSLKNAGAYHTIRGSSSRTLQSLRVGLQDAASVKCVPCTSTHGIVGHQRSPQHCLRTLSPWTPCLRQRASTVRCSSRVPSCKDGQCMQDGGAHGGMHPSDDVESDVHVPLLSDPPHTQPRP